MKTQAEIAAEEEKYRPVAPAYTTADLQWINDATCNFMDFAAGGFFGGPGDMFVPLVIDPPGTEKEQGQQQQEEAAESEDAEDGFDEPLEGEDEAEVRASNQEQAQKSTKEQDQKAFERSAPPEYFEGREHEKPNTPVGASGRVLARTQGRLVLANPSNGCADPPASDEPTRYQGKIVLVERGGMLSL